MLPCSGFKPFSETSYIFIYIWVYNVKKCYDIFEHIIIYYTYYLVS